MSRLILLRNIMNIVKLISLGSQIIMIAQMIMIMIAHGSEPTINGAYGYILVIHVKYFVILRKGFLAFLLK